MISKFWLVIAMVAFALGCGQTVRTADGPPEKTLVEPLTDSADVIENRFGMRFVFVPFPAEPGQSLKKIYLGDSEVTWEQYRRFKVASGQRVEPYERKPSDQPLMALDFDTWMEASEFAEQLTALDPKYSYRMPSEAEWEFACRGGSNDNPRPSTNCTSDGHWVVKQREPNGYGLYDMLGVLGEYCSDFYRSEKYPVPEWGFAEGRDARVVRGERQSATPVGCFRYEMEYRYPVSPDGQGEPPMTIGVRLVLEPK